MLWATPICPDTPGRSQLTILLHLTTKNLIAVVFIVMTNDNILLSTFDSI